MPKSAIQRQPNGVSEKINDSLVAQETSADKRKNIITDNGEKTTRAVDTSSMVALNIKSTTSSAKESENVPKHNHTLESGENKKNAHNVSMGDDGKSVQRNISRDVTEMTQQITQHINTSNVEREKNNATEKYRGQIVRDSVSNSDTKSQSEGTHAQEETVKQTPAEHGKQTTKQFDQSDKESNVNIEGQNNISSLTQIKNDTQEEISERTNETVNKTGKTRVLETLKINFLKKNRTSHLDENNSSITQISDLETQRNEELPALHNESNSKSDSVKMVDLSKSSPVASGSDKTGSSVKISNLNKSDGKTNSIESQPGVQGDKKLSSNKGIDKDNKTRTTTLAKSEKIIVNLNGKQWTSKENKRNISVNETRVAPNVNDQKVKEETHKNTQKGEASASALQRKSHTRKTDLDANSAQLKMKSTVVHNEVHNMNTSSTNINSKEDGSKSSLTSKNVQRDHEHLEPLTNGSVKTSNIKSGALDSSKGNETIAKVKPHATKNDKSSSEIGSESSLNHDGSSKDSKIPHVGPERRQNTLDKNSTQPVKKMKDNVEKMQTERSSENSSKSVNDLSDLTKKKKLESMKILTTNTSHTRIAENSQKLERSNHSQGATSNVEEKRVTHVQDDVKPLNEQKGMSVPD